ncbi:hypothetical protein DRO97_06040 [Archaeoglobales archaeon]|nr:MAG: hypothetical protein DRO97_06040 [Archaeoglobales archaeon]
MYGRVVIFVMVTMLLIVSRSCAEQTDQTCNCTELKEEITKLNTRISNLNKQILNLKRQVESLKSENLKLEAQNDKLQNELNNLRPWDARNLMDKLFIFTVTPAGKEYKLLFHEGGLGGVIVYQYVGLWQGDAGKWRQYKQIAFFRGIKGKEGYMKPGVVLKPVWGFDGAKEVKITSISDLIKWEKKYNSLEGLAEYYRWVFDRYVETSGYAVAKLIFVAVIMAVFGMFFGEIKRPIRRFLDYITIRRISSFRLTPEEEKKGLFRRIFRRGGGR